MSEKRFVTYQTPQNEELAEIRQLKEDNEQLQKQLEQTDFALHRSHLQVKKLKDENEQLRKENIALDNENAEHLADNIRELELLEKLTKFLHECDLTDEQRALFRDMITEEDLQPKFEHQTWKWKYE